MYCFTSKQIKFQDFNNEWVHIETNTEIYVDRAEGIAFYNGMHFYIEPNEYIVLN